MANGSYFETTASLSAMGKKVFILLPYVPDYRWMLDRIDTPWYPTAILFRQPVLNDWSSVLNQVQFNLYRFLEECSVASAYNQTC